MLDAISDKLISAQTGPWTCRHMLQRSIDNAKGRIDACSIERANTAFSRKTPMMTGCQNPV